MIRGEAPSGGGRPSEQLRRIAGSGEEILWRGKPDKIAFGAVRGTQYLIAILLSTIVLYPIPILIGIVPNVYPLFFLLLVLGMLLLWNEYKHREYAVTSDRLIQFSGIIGRDYSTVAWEDVQDFETDVGVIDKIFGTGTISARPAGATPTRGQGVWFQFIKEPYKTTEILNEYL